MSHKPKHRSKEEHKAMIDFMKSKLKLALIQRRYTMSFKKDELDTLITACMLAGECLEMVEKEEDSEKRS